MNQRPSPTTFIAVTPTMRELIENVIEDLMLLLDEIDGDADFEEQHDREDDPAEWGIADDDGLAEQFPSAFHGGQCEMAPRRRARPMLDFATHRP